MQRFKGIMSVCDDPAYVVPYDVRKDFDFEEFAQTIVELDEVYRGGAKKRAEQQLAFFTSMVDRFGVDSYKELVKKIAESI